MRLQGGMKNDESMTSAGIADDRQVKRNTSEPCSGRSGIDEVKLSGYTINEMRERKQTRKDG